MLKRKLESIVIEMSREFRVIYLTGPRQAGKTTLVRSIAQQMGYEYLSFDDAILFQAAKQDPLGFLTAYQNKKLVLDEFQYVPELISAIKLVSDQLPPQEKGKFLLTGSADIFKSAKAQEALPGHMARLELYPLSLSEMKQGKGNVVDILCREQFSELTGQAVTSQEIAQWILAGGYPEIQGKTPRAKMIWYRSYLEGRLFKDFEILYAARGEYRAKLHALIPYLAGLSGNLVKYANIANDLMQDDKSIKSYIAMLELMFIVKLVPAYLNNRAKRLAVTMPKLHMIDTGLACNLLGFKREAQLLQSIHFGGLLENFIFMELMKHNTWAEEPVEFFHYRDKQQHEVDIVLECEDHQVIGIEVKASSTVRIEDFRNLIRFAESHASRFQYGILFYAGKHILSFSQNNIRLYAMPMSILK